MQNHRDSGSLMVNPAMAMLQFGAAGNPQKTLLTCILAVARLSEELADEIGTMKEELEGEQNGGGTPPSLVRRRTTVALADVWPADERQ